MDMCERAVLCLYAPICAFVNVSMCVIACVYVHGLVHVNAWKFM